jgi:1-acyl-sn-glycerol-3-phosphate acyltransferase
MIATLLKFLTRIVFSVVYRVEIMGKENIPKTGSAIVCANHLGWQDMFFIGYKSKRLVHYMAKNELFKNPLYAFILTHLGAFPVKRGTGDVGAIKTAFTILKKGEILGILPEGTRAHLHKVKRNNPGIALFSLKTGAPVVPVALEGSYRLFSRVRIIFGEPFYINAEPGKKYTNDELLNISDKIMERVFALLNK